MSVFDVVTHSGQRKQRTSDS